MGGAYIMCGGEENCIQSSGGETYCGTYCMWQGENEMYL